jgi:predicted  nucleic acid-binding Zn-ribbon protein
MHESRDVSTTNTDARIGRAIITIITAIAIGLGSWFVLDIVQSPRNTEARLQSSVAIIGDRLTKDEEAADNLRIELTKISATVDTLRARIAEVDAQLQGVLSAVSTKKVFDEDDFERERRVLDVELKRLHDQVEDLQRQIARLEQHKH